VNPRKNRRPQNRGLRYTFSDLTLRTVKDYGETVVYIHMNEERSHRGVSDALFAIQN
jgi:hypothetical protein